MSYVTQLECAHCGKSYEAGRVHNLCPAVNAGEKPVR